MKPFYPSVKRIPRLYYWIAWALCNLICGMAEWVLLVEYGNGNSPYMLAALCAVGLFHFLYLTLFYLHIAFQLRSIFSNSRAAMLAG